MLFRSIHPKMLWNLRKKCGTQWFKASEKDFVEADVFEYLRQNSLDYDLVILDPPAFAKHKSEIMRASRGYKDINMVAMKNASRQHASDLFVLIQC